jgi:diphosphomevalonate decarboxylase
MDNQCLTHTCRGPINIALIKYWGKEDEENIIPLNNSISVTLEKTEFFTETKAELYPNNLCSNKLILDGKEEPISKRVLKIINYMRSKCINPIYAYGQLTITSYNSFPTAAGCASSASSMSCLVKVLSKLFLNDSINDVELSKLARIGSGSACRSIYGGFVEWHKYIEEQKDSVAIQLYDENHWEDLNILLLIVNDKRKDTSSTDGMKNSKETSNFLNYRVENILPKRLQEMRDAIKDKDFNKICELTIKDSNNFHSVCRDTFPTICYMNDTSNFIVKIIDKINNHFNQWICAYTFDAGPNAFLIILNKNVKFVTECINYIFSIDENIPKVEDSFFSLLKELKSQRLAIGGNIKDIKKFKVGKGVE